MTVFGINPPAREEGLRDGVGVVGPGGDHDGADAGGVQVLDGAQPDAADAVDDHMPGEWGVASGGGAVRSRGDPVDGGHAGIVLDRPRCAESGFRYIYRTEATSRSLRRAPAVSARPPPAGRTGIVASFEHALEQKVLPASSFRCVSTLIYFLAATAIAP